MYVPSQDSVRVMYMCMRVSAIFLLRCMCQARTVFETCICVWGFLSLFHLDVCAKPWQCSSHVFVYEGSSHYSIKMCVPSQDSVRVMRKEPWYTYTWPEHCPGLAHTSQYNSCGQHHTPIHDPNTVLAWHIHLNRIVWGTCNYSIKMCVSRKDNVRVMYMCMRVPVTILLYVCAKPGQCSGHVYVDGGSHIHDSNTILAWHTHLNWIVAGTLIHLYMTRTLSWLGRYI
jgi:hypothetical protein